MLACDAKRQCTGGYKVMRDAERLMLDATIAEQAGAFGVLIECVPAVLASQLTNQLKVPTIGIGAGADCDGRYCNARYARPNQRYVPKFVRTWANLSEHMSQAFVDYRDQVRDGTFPIKMKRSVKPSQPLTAGRVFFVCHAEWHVSIPTVFDCEPDLVIKTTRESS